jgi:hypothetical protein
MAPEGVLDHDGGGGGRGDQLHLVLFDFSLSRA